jgi:cyclic 2,3-diphosphoglycerate synthetase
MGRGGPETPEIIDGATRTLDAAALLEISRAGRHASSDHFENALLSRVTAVGSRRCGGGLAGMPYVSNVVEAGRVADRLAPPAILFDGSGAAIPPVMVDRRVLILGAHQKIDTLRGYFAPFRIRIADVILVTMCEPPLADATRLEEIRATVSAINPRAHLVETVFRPRPCYEGSLAGKRVFVALTAPETMGPTLAAHLEKHHGVQVVGLTHALADRRRLRADLAQGLETRPDVVLTEIKAASIDVVAEEATRAGIPVGFLDNIPIACDAAIRLEEWLAFALDLEPLRERAAAQSRRG